MKYLYFTRHGLSEMNIKYQRSGSTNTPLHSEGHEQARAAGASAKEKGLKFDLIISSPLERAYDTAKHIAKYANYPVEKIMLDDRLKERDFGELEGEVDTPEMIQGYKKSEAYIDRYEGVEQLVELQKRLDDFYKYLKTLSADSILVVAHGASGRALHRSVTGAPIDYPPIVFKNAEIHRFL